MASRRQPYVFHVTHRQVADPRAVERGLQLWARYLAEHLRRQAAEQTGRRPRRGTA